MKPWSRQSLAVVLPALLGALLLLAWFYQGRRARVEYVSNLSAESAHLDPATTTGWEGNRRWLIAPEHNNNSYQWIIETQQMQAQDTWRLRQVVYDNGREPRNVSSTAPYRCWLAFSGWLQRAVAGDSPAVAIERAALFTDPLLLAIAVGVGVIVLWFGFGPWPAAVWAVAAAGLYPFAASFVPGAPDSPSLSLLLALVSVLAPALSFLQEGETGGSRATGWMILGGLAGALGLWVDAFIQLPILGGFAGAALLAAILPAADRMPSAPRLWRWWGWSGAVASGSAYLLEYCPDRMSWDFHGNHPAISLGWVAVAELLAMASNWRAASHPGSRWTAWLKFGLAAGGVTLLGWVLWKSEHPWLQGRDVFGTRLTSLPQAATGVDSAAWMRQEGAGSQLLATFLPLGLVVIPIWLAGSRRAASATRLALLPGLGALLVAALFAWHQLRWWAAATGLLLALWIPVTILLGRSSRPVALRAWLAGILACLLPGIIYQKPAAQADFKEALTQLEVESLVERSLAHWLADHAAGNPVLLAPPFRTTALAFHGNIPVLGSLNLANKDALVAAARIAAATSADEADALMKRRGVTHILIPSWDGYLDEYTRQFAHQPQNTFAAALKNWAMPPWLRPVAYQVPAIGGFENQSVAIFERSDEQDTATTVARLAEYFLEMDRADLVMLAASGLASHPDNLAALAALAQVEIARGDAPGFQTTLKTLLTVYGSSDEHELSWDRRVTLAVVLMQGQHPDLARREMEICLNLIDEPQLRSLSVGSLYRFQVLLRALKLEIQDPRLRTLALTLLPDGLRARLQ